MKPADYEDKLYLDVYLKYTKDGSGNNTGLEPYGYVLFKEGTDGSNNVSILYDSTVQSETNKVASFEPEEYHTYNVDVKKTVSGAMADQTHNFPFKIELANATITSQADFYYQVTTDGVIQNDGATPTVNNTTTDGALANNGSCTIGTIADGNGALNFQNNDHILITGLPTGTTIKVSELNNTVDTYVATATLNTSTTVNLDNGSTTNQASVTLSPTNTAAFNTAVSVAQASGADQIIVNNNLEQVSPTGVTLRFGPYLLMAGAAVALLVIMARRRKDNEDKSNSI